jgi:hypothetical protein
MKGENLEHLKLKKFVFRNENFDAFESVVGFLALNRSF